jgi:glycosyltransferase involved in cell wall biosynthesis
VLTATSPATTDAIAQKSDSTTAIEVVHIHRKPFAGQYSIEVLFGSIRRELRHFGLKVRSVMVPHFSKGVFRRISNAWHISKVRADVYHITGDIHYVALLLPREKTILTIHDCASLERLNGLKRWLFKLVWFDLPIHRVKYVTLISEEAKRQLQRHINVAAEKLHVIPNTVSPIFQPSARAKINTYPRILHIGTKENKNLSRVLQALKGIPCHLRIVGRLSDQQLLEAKLANVEISSVCNLTEESMYSEYCLADLVCFVSTYEGFGLPIIEANAVGRPVVTSNVSSMPEVAGDACCQVDPYNVESIRAGIERVIREPEYCEQLIRNGFDNAQRFCPAVIASKYIALYRQISGKSRGIAVS